MCRRAGDSEDVVPPIVPDATWLYLKLYNLGNCAENYEVVSLP